MDIGEEQRTIRVEPAISPIPKRKPAAPPQPVPARPRPQRTPQRKPEKVPAR